MALDDDLLTTGGVRVQLSSGVATVTMDRPDRRNAQTPSMWRALQHVGDQLDDDVRVVVLRGAGQSFSAGLDRRLFDGSGIPGEGDIPSLLGMPDAEVLAWIDQCQQGFLWLRDPRWISIAVVQGHAYGAGFQLALSCDYRIATQQTQLCLKETALGLVPDLTGTKPLVEIVGYSRALDIAATARVVDGEEAHRIGLVNVLCEAGELDDELAAAVTRFTASVHGAVTGTKRLVQQASEQDLEAQRETERRMQLGRLRDLAAALGG
jgi:enoyl-CoA hydratase/carnithine racemase